MTKVPVFSTTRKAFSLNICFASFLNTHIAKKLRAKKQIFEIGKGLTEIKLPMLYLVRSNEQYNIKITSFLLAGEIHFKLAQI